MDTKIKPLFRNGHERHTAMGDRSLQLALLERKQVTLPLPDIQRLTLPWSGYATIGL
jgi:hypothetical protein